HEQSSLQTFYHHHYHHHHNHNHHHNHHHHHHRFTTLCMCLYSSDVYQNSSVPIAACHYNPCFQLPILHILSNTVHPCLPSPASLHDNTFHYHLTTNRQIKRRNEK